ncbi:MAG: aminoglycoside phosphotransferase family protein [Clostridia bacterium]
MNNFEQIVQKFDIDGKLLTAENYGCGHINATYLLTMQDNTNFILQKINDNIFKDVDGLMNNIVGITEYIRSNKLKSGQSADNCMLVVKAKNGKNYVEFENGYYRIYTFVKDALSIETTPTPAQLELSGKGFGSFQKELDGYPVETLVETIPNFHNTKDRLRKFELAIKENKSGRAEDVAKEIEFFVARKDYASKIVDMLASGKMTARVTHNDTKLNNLLIDMSTNSVVAVIDLDTVMQGCILYDFGDSIRSGANIGAEDEPNLDKVGFSLELFDAFAKGFVGAVKEKLTQVEIEYMAFGAILMTYECGMRFLSDHIDGDTYFKIHRPNHNLDRARTQIKMVEDMEKLLPKMNEVVKKYAK